MDIKTLNYPLAKLSPETLGALVEAKAELEGSRGYLRLFICQLLGAISGKALKEFEDVFEFSIEGGSTLNCLLVKLNTNQNKEDFLHVPFEFDKALRLEWIDQLLEFNNG